MAGSAGRQPLDPDYLHRVMQAVLKTAQNALTAAGRPMPGSTYLTWDTPAMDCCDVLVLSLNRLRPRGRSTRGTGRPPFAAIFEANMQLTISRCVEVGTPTTAQQEADAAELQRDIWVLTQSLECAAIDAKLLGTMQYPGAGEETQTVTISQVSITKPTGGCAGAVFELHVELLPVP